MSGEVLAVSDADFYLQTQPSKGVAPSGPFKTALRFTQVTASTQLNGVDGEAGLGLGLYTGEAVGLSFQVEWSAKARLTLATMPNYILGWFCNRATTGSGPYWHKYTPILRNFSLPWLMMAVVYGEGATRGTGLKTVYFQDARLGGLDFAIAANDVVRFNINGPALNSGPGIGTEAFEADTTEYIPGPVNPANNIYTLPTTLLPSGTPCINSVQFKWNPSFQLAPACLGSGEMGGVVITMANWTVTFSLRADDVSLAIADRINFKTDTPNPGYAELDPAYLKGDFDFSMKSVDLIGATSPLNVPYAFEGHYPLQYKKATVKSDSSPNTVEIEAVTYNDLWWLRHRNNIAGSGMIF
jgi:hypothetical protein